MKDVDNKSILGRSNQEINNAKMMVNTIGHTRDGSNISKR